MVSAPHLTERTTSADMVFGALYEEIVGLNLLPGARISETEVAKRFDLSRQPIREAFARLSRLGLIRITPQRPTLVRYFSLEEIQNARFIRAGVEIEVFRRACEDRDETLDGALQDIIDEQKSAATENDAERFHDLDYAFHRMLCKSARAEFAFDVIASNKAQVDRLCMLSLASQASMELLYEDHVKILAAITAGDKSEAEALLRQHLNRLSPTIDSVYHKHREYFE